jgi:Helix-turn-helix domain/RodZ C-terminal domain
VFEIGTSLREARLRRGVDLPQVEQITKIRVKYLRALEDEQFEQLPSQTYVKGFLRTYAEYLGLDGQLYVDEYNSRYVVGEEDYRPRRSSVRPQRRNRRFETNVVLVVLALIAIGTIVVISAWKSSGPDHRLPQVQTTAAAAKPRFVPPLLAIGAVRGSSQLAVHQGSASGRLRYEGTLLKGQTEVFRGAPRYWVQIASPENVVVRVRGRLVEVRGNRPRVIVVTPTGIRPVS